jgi:hypothetical protein
MRNGAQKKKKLNYKAQTLSHMKFDSVEVSVTRDLLRWNYVK